MGLWMSGLIWDTLNHVQFANILQRAEIQMDQVHSFYRMQGNQLPQMKETIYIYTESFEFSEVAANCYGTHYLSIDMSIDLCDWEQQPISQDYFLS